MKMAVGRASSRIPVSNNDRRKQEIAEIQDSGHSTRYFEEKKTHIFVSTHSCFDEIFGFMLFPSRCWSFKLALLFFLSRANAVADALTVKSTRDLTTAIIGTLPDPSDDSRATRNKKKTDLRREKEKKIRK